MDNVCLVKSVLNLTSFDILDCFCNVHCYCTSLRVRHETFRSKYSSETSNNTHHIWCSYNYVEFEPVLVLDLWNELVSTYEICSSSFSFLSFSVFSKYKDTNLFTCSVWQYNCSTNLLVSVTSVTTCSDMSLDCLIKFCYCSFFNQCYCVCYIIECSSVDGFCSLNVFLSSFHYK